MRSKKSHGIGFQTASRGIALSVLVTAALGTGSCFKTGTHECESGRLRCGVDQLCVPGNGLFEDHCAPRIPAEACIGLEEESACTYQGVPLGFCRQGSCVSASCGNGFTETGLNEVCDDGNNEHGDGCSADCLSDETCGNRFIDFQVGERCDDANALSHDGCASACQPEERVWQEVSLDPLSPRYEHAMAYDAARGRVILFGGRDGSFRNDTWEWDGTTWSEISPPTSPSPRYDHAMAYDAERGRVVLFGGSYGLDRYDTWEWDGTTWSRISPPASPSPRSRHAMAYDAGRGRVVLFGGSDDSRRNDTWEWDGSTWSELSPAVSPLPRYDHAMAYDPARGRVVLFGGSYGSLRLGDTWEWDGTTWSEISPPASPSPRSNHAMAYDPARGRVVLFGGSDGSFRNDTWEWDGTTWSEISPPASPSSRSHHAMAYDPAHGRVVLFGGSASYALLDDTWEWDGTTWSEILPPASPSPSPRRYHALAYDAARARVVLFGGYASYALLDDTWEWDGTTWSRISPPASPSPSPRSYHAMAYDAARGRVVLFGGSDGYRSYRNDTWEWDGTTWSELSLPASFSPSPRYLHAMAYDAARDRVVLFGGYSDNGYRNDTWEWNGITWSELSPPASPSPRNGHAMAYDAARGRVVLFGGYNGSRGSEWHNDTWEWDGSTWSELSPAVSPSPLNGHVMAYDAARGRVVLFGGYDGSLMRNDTWEWDGSTWSRISPPASPSPRDHHAMAYDAVRGRVVLFGGNDDALLPPLGDAWFTQYRSSTSPDESCRFGRDTDGDGLIGCDDPDCWAYCTPSCPPGAACDPTAPRCGDGLCNQHLETYRLCPQDCAPDPVCGDFFCDPDETAATCPGDCRA